MHAVGSVCELVKHCCHQNVGSCHGILTAPDFEPYDLNHSVARLHLLHVQVNQALRVMMAGMDMLAHQVWGSLTAII